MQPLWDWGISMIAAFQSLPWLTSPMTFFSFWGSEEFYLFILPLLYWCVDAALGLRVGLILLFSTWLNDVLKILLQAPRPFWYSTGVRAYADETTFGIPSGHAQNAVAVWGTIAYYLHRPWAWVASITVMFLIGISRLYLGVHFPTDVLAGWLIGGILLFCFIKFWDPVAAWLKKLTLARQMLLSFLVSLGFIGVVELAVLSLGGWTLPAGWLMNAAVAFPSGPAPDPLNISGTVSMAGTLFGLTVGLAWFSRQGGFSVEGPIGQRVARFGVGVIGVALLYLGLKFLLPSGDGTIAYLFRYLRYGLVGAWVSAGAPWLFVRLKLARPE